MNYWLIKSEPHTYSFEQMKTDKKTMWEGVRNYQARNNMKEMKKGDIALFYHSGKDRQVVGEVEIVKEFYQDPTTEDTNWVVVEVKFKKTFANPVNLADIKGVDSLSEMHLVRNSRLSVSSVRKDEYEMIIEMAKS
ncbi:MAG: EVE domain-containing protein [Ignavibacteriae bacterium HGW-Ignavibacteriae-4]|nr:MAG: EVE domain-containing protein [Ignavibacteriae bacterium HGW-Ignavibacteriae-4]